MIKNKEHEFMDDLFVFLRKRIRETKVNEFSALFQSWIVLTDAILKYPRSMTESSLSEEAIGKGYASLCKKLKNNLDNIIETEGKRLFEELNGK